MENTDRRAFLGNLSTASLAAVYPASFQGYVGNLTAAQTQPILKPKALGKGSRIGLVSPASNVYEREEVRMACEIAESFGFRVELGRHAADSYGYLAGEDAGRAEDLNEMFRRQDIDAIWAIRGGYGAGRLLPFLDYAAIRQNPKPLIGYSDITALHLAIQRLSGVVTFHGPIARQLFSEYTLKSFKKALFETAPLGEIASPPPFTPAEGKTEWANRVLTLYGGKAGGIVTGGNLSLVTATLGTPFEVETRGRILFLEEVGEAPYRVDRMLTQLWLSGKLAEVAGIVLGKFTDCRPPDYRPGFHNTLSVEEVLRTRLAPLRKPCLYGLMFGHTQDNATIPMGLRASLDADAGRFSIDEPAVV